MNFNFAEHGNNWTFTVCLSDHVKKTEKIKYLSLKAILVVALPITNFRSQCKALQN